MAYWCIATCVCVCHGASGLSLPSPPTSPPSCPEEMLRLAAGVNRPVLLYSSSLPPWSGQTKQTKIEYRGEETVVYRISTSALLVVHSRYRRNVYTAPQWHLHTPTRAWQGCTDTAWIRNEENECHGTDVRTECTAWGGVGTMVRSAIPSRV